MRVGKANGGDWLRLAEAASALGVSHNTIRAWSDDGRLRCYRSPGGHRRYRRSDIDALLGDTPATTPPHAHGESAAGGQAWQDSALDALLAVAVRGSDTTSGCVAVQETDETLRIAAVYGDGDTPPPGARVPTAAVPAETEVVHSQRRLHIPDVARTRLLARATADDYCRRGFLSILALPVVLSDGRMGVLRLADSRGPHSFDLAAMTFAELMARHAGILLSGDPHHEPATSPGATSAGGPGTGALPAPLPPPDPDADALGSDDAVRAVAQAAVDTLSGRPDLAFCNVHLVRRGRARTLASSGGALPSEWDARDLPAAGRDGVDLVRRDDSRLTPGARARFFDARDVTALLLAPVDGDGETVALLEAGGVDLGALWAAQPAVKGTATLLAAALRTGQEQADLRAGERDLAILREAWQRDTSRLSTDEVLRGLVERLAQATRVPIVEVYAVEGDTARALVSYDGGRWDGAWEEVVLRLERYPASRRAAETGEPVLIGGLDDEGLDPDGRFSLERWGYQSHLSVPLTAGGRTLGLLELYDYVPHDFAPELELAQGVARLAALALDADRRTEQIRRRNRIISELGAIARICAAADDPETILARVAESLLTALDAASCQVFRLTPRGVLCIAAHDRSGRDDEAVGLVGDLRSYPTALHAMNARDVLAVSSPHDERFSETERAAYRAGGWTSEVCVPLVLKEHVGGFIDIVDSRSRTFTDYADFLRSVAGTLAVALEAARLEDEVTRRSGDLSSIAGLSGLHTGAGEGGEALEHLAAEVREHVGAADCDVFSLDDGALRCLISVDQRGRDDEVATRPLDIDDYPATAQAVRSGEMVVIPDLDDPRLSDQERVVMASWGFRSEVCVPLVRQGRVTGILDVFDGRPRDFAEHHEYLRAAARVAAAHVAAAAPADRGGRPGEKEQSAPRPGHPSGDRRSSPPDTPP